MNRVNRAVGDQLRVSQAQAVLVIHNRLKAASHLHDRKHLAMRKPEPGQCSGVQILAAGLFTSVMGKVPNYSILREAQEATGFDGRSRINQQGY